MARHMIVLEGNRAEHEVPLQLLFLYHDMPTITTASGAVVIPTPQGELMESTKEVLEAGELTALDAGTMAAEQVGLTKPEGVNTPAQLSAFLQLVRSTYWVMRARFIQRQLDKWTLRGAAFDAGEEPR